MKEISNNGTSGGPSCKYKTNIGIIMNGIL